jgi:hypothetical protein
LPPARGLVAHYRFEDGSGSQTASDVSGNRRHCLLHDLDPRTAWVEGPVGGALDLGEGGWLECPQPEVRAGAPMEMSIALWARQTGRFEEQAALLTRQLPSADASHLFWFGFRGDSLQVWSQAWTGWATRPVAGRERWRHLAFVHRDRTTTLYLDGMPYRQKDDNRPRGQGLVTSPLTIGAMRFRADPLRVRNNFHGLIDEVLIYSRALTDAEVRALATREPRPAP